MATLMRLAFDRLRADRDEARERLGEVAIESGERHATIIAILTAAGVDFGDLNEAARQLNEAGPQPSLFVARLKAERDAAVAERERLRDALAEIVKAYPAHCLYYGGETYAALCRRIQSIARNALKAPAMQPRHRVVLGDEKETVR